MTVQRLPVPGGTIAYRLRGTGPPLVLLTTLAGTWQRQIPRIAKDFTVLSYDLRGFGESTSATGFPGNAEHADDLAALLDALDLPAAVVVGLSHGGLVGQHFAVKHPDRLAGLCLAATFATPRDSTGLFLRMLNGFLDRGDLDGFWEVLKSFLFSSANADKLLRREELLRRAMFDQYTVASLRSIYGQAIEHDSSAWLGGIRCPAVVVGGAHDMLFPPAVTGDLADLIPDARLVLLSAAHVPPVEVPQAFNDIVLRYFRGVHCGALR
jgi:pimeloyl-ACP methyl ester carboxylesterase